MGFGMFISPAAVRSHRVPSLGGYVKDTYNHSPFSLITFLIGCTGGMVSGGIHCMSWNFLFQGQIAWRVASLVILCVPFVTFVIFLIRVSYGPDPSISGLGQPIILLRQSDNFFLMWGAASITIYIIARIGLIVLMFMSLRSLPPGVYDTVAWTEFIPHY